MPILGVVASSYAQLLSGFVALDSYTFPTSTANTVTFSSIPQGYKHLYLVYQARGTINNGTRMYFNGDTTNGNYTTGYVISSAPTGTYVDDPNATPGIEDLFSLLGGYTSTDCSSGFAYINDYSKSGKIKTVTGMSTNLNSFGEGSVGYNGGAWTASTAPITSITITARSQNFVAGSMIALFGVN